MNNKIVKLAVILFLVSAIVAALLGLVNSITAPRIEELKAEKMAKAMSEVLPASGYEQVDYTGDDVNIQSVYQAADAGWVVDVIESGSQGNIEMMVGIKADGTVSGVSVISHSETSGLGAVAASTGADGQAFRSQFVGLTNAAVTKDGGTVDAISGATITSRAVCTGVNAALAAVK